MSKKNVTESYRKLSEIISKLDNNSRLIISNTSSLSEMRDSIVNTERNIMNLQEENEILIAKAKEISKESGLPFEYSAPEEDEWDSSDDWNSSSQYC